MPIRRLLKAIRAFGRSVGAPFVPPGHFYSPIVDPKEIAAERNRIWPARPVAAGVDWNDDGHRQLLVETPCDRAHLGLGLLQSYVRSKSSNDGPET